MASLIPSPDVPDGMTALRLAMKEAASISAAVAYVTESGVDRLAELAREGTEVTFEICARGAPITQRSALVRLRDELGAAVSLVTGQDAQRYHPKLWLIRAPRVLYVLAGSGNLTEGGLLTNIEQFEFTQYDQSSPLVEAQEKRFEEITSCGVPLNEVIQSPAWYEWAAQEKKRANLLRQLQGLDEILASRKASGRENDKRLLCADLYDLYERTVAAKLPRADGKAYIPNYFKRGLDTACSINNPVPFVARVCRHQTEGFDVILAHGGPELTVEALVIDGSKPYHDLFDDTTLQLSTERLRQFAQ